MQYEGRRFATPMKVSAANLVTQFRAMYVKREKVLCPLFGYIVSTCSRQSDRPAVAIFIG